MEPSNRFYEPEACRWRPDHDSCAAPARRARGHPFQSGGSTPTIACGAGARGADARSDPRAHDAEVRPDADVGALDIRVATSVPLPQPTARPYARTRRRGSFGDAEQSADASRALDARAVAPSPATRRPLSRNRPPCRRPRPRLHRSQRDPRRARRRGRRTTSHPGRRHPGRRRGAECRTPANSSSS